MSARLTDEQVANWVAGNVGRATTFDAVDLAAEVAAYRAMRPKCPTCDGSGQGKHSHPIVDPADIDDNGHLIPYPCPANCEDGFMPLADWVKLLIETLRYVKAGQPWANPVDAVLKMAGDQ